MIEIEEDSEKTSESFISGDDLVMWKHQLSSNDSTVGTWNVLMEVAPVAAS
jgi:hypothetical protein